MKITQLQKSHATAPFKQSSWTSGFDPCLSHGWRGFDPPGISRSFVGYKACLVPQRMQNLRSTTDGDFLLYLYQLDPGLVHLNTTVYIQKLFTSKYENIRTYSARQISNSRPERLIHHKIVTSISTCLTIVYKPSLPVQIK